MDGYHKTPINTRIQVSTTCDKAFSGKVDKDNYKFEEGGDQEGKKYPKIV